MITYEHIGVDFDGTLAHYKSGQYPMAGEPIKDMVSFVKRKINEGERVVIFTARVSDPSHAKAQTDLIQTWCLIHLGHKLDVTCIKSHKMKIFYDDKARQVYTNTGILAC